MATGIPIIRVDIAGFSALANPQERRAILSRLETVIAASLKPHTGRFDPSKVFNWHGHGTGDGFYIPLNDCSSPVAMRSACDLEKILTGDNLEHRDYPLKLRIALTFGDVESVGQQSQLLSDAFTEAQRLIDDPRVKALLELQTWQRPAVLVTSSLFMDDWKNHSEKNEADVAVLPELPWVRTEFEIKHGKKLTGYIQVEESIFKAIRVSPSSAPPPPGCDLLPWLKSLMDRTDKIAIRGIGNRSGNPDAGLYNIEQLYTTLRSSTGERSSSASVDLAQLLPKHKRLLIEGQPGAGKTTFLRLVAAMLAKDHLGISCPGALCWRERYLGLQESDKPLIPLFLRLSELAALLAQDEPPTPADDRRRLLDLLALSPNATDNEACRNHWRGLLERGEVILLLDGLDEVADEGLRERVFAIVRDAIDHWGQSSMVVTSRPFGVERIKGIGFHHTVIAPFGQTEIREFIDRWVTALHQQGASGRLSVAADHHESLLQAILEKPAIKRLAANPVMLTCLCVVHWNEGGLPEGRARVYQAVIHWLIAARSEKRKNAGYNDRFALEAFAKLAMVMMMDGKGGKQAVFEVEEGAEAVEPLVGRHFKEFQNDKPGRLRLAREWLRFECLGSGIIEELGSQRLKFWHLTFQEYLAAQALAWMGDGEQPDEDFWPTLRDRLVDPQWRETVSLLPGTLFDGGGSLRVDKLLRKVLALRGNNPTLAWEARLVGIMGRLLEPMSAYGYPPPQAIDQSYQLLRERVMAIFTPEGAQQVPITTRIEAAEALGQAGDSRLQTLNLIEVPDTDGWHLEKYLVTVQEYQLFMEYDGYQEQRWWKNAGWSLRMKEGWESPEDWEDQLLHLNRPVTGVSWFEAMAYCRWLSDLHKKTICLPDESLWEKAATSDQGEYPWGKQEPTARLANFNNNVGSPTPVGLYPDGNGPLGHCDLAGNAWEWQRNFYKNENFTNVSLDPLVTGDDVLVLRGGSWFNPAVSLKLAYRNGTPSWDRDVNISFRVAAAPASG